MPTERSFEWVFVVPEISGPDDPRIDRLDLIAEALVESHGGLSLASVLVPGDSALAAGRLAIDALSVCDLCPTRTYPELVTRADIANRLNKTQSAVNNWIRGDRQKRFPPPVHLVGSGLWLWYDIAAWASSGYVPDLPDDDGVQYPTLRDHTSIDWHLRNRYTPSQWPDAAPLVVATTTASWVDTAVSIAERMPVSRGSGPLFGVRRVPIDS